MTPRVVVVGLGPAGPDLVSAGTRQVIDDHDVRFARTMRHPSSTTVVGARSFDDLYDAAETMTEVYTSIVDALVDAATEQGAVVYAVPGSPMVAEHTVELLLADDRVEVELHPAMSFLDLVWVRLGVDPIAAGVRVVDGHRFAVDAAGERGPLLVAQCDRRSVLSDIKLSVDPPPDGPVVVLQGLGTEGERIESVAWEDLDRSVEPDHLTSVWIPRLAAPVAGEVGAFVELVERLRDECPWDQEQTHRSLTPFLIEEAYEVVGVLDQMPAEAGALGRDLDSDPDDGQVDDLYLALEEELGDLLFQIVFHARLATEAGRFDLADVVRGIHDKLVARHPHVFGDIDVGGDARVVEENWERIKAAEPGRQSAFDGIPASLPSLRYVAALIARADRLGLAHGAGDGDPSIGSEEILIERLLSAVVSARTAGLDVDDALRRRGREMERRLRAAESTTSA